MRYHRRSVLQSTSHASESNAESNVDVQPILLPRPAPAGAGLEGNKQALKKLKPELPAKSIPSVAGDAGRLTSSPQGAPTSQTPRYKEVKRAENIFPKPTTPPPKQQKAHSHLSLNPKILKLAGSLPIR